MRRTVPVLFVALLITACAGPGGTTTSAPSVVPGASGAAACSQAPGVPDDLPGWGQPATTPEITPVYIAPSIATCGDNRVLFGLVDKQGRPVGAPDRTVRVAFFDLGRDTDRPFATVDGTFIWAIENAIGVYAMHVAFPEAGRYGAEVTTGSAGAAPATIRMTFDVRATSPVVGVGDRAPASTTPTLGEVGGDPKKISTDQSPDPALYETSIDQALAKKEPFVVVFATPKFCQTAQCGPTLERIKPFLARYPSVTFINVEPYRLKLVDGVLEADVDANGALQAVDATNEWQLLSEPNVYVVDRNGVVTANFELIFSDAELTAALDAVK